MNNEKTCIKCGRAATHKFIRLRDGKVVDMYLCAEHAAEASPYQKNESHHLKILLDKLYQSEPAVKGAHHEGPGDLTCALCGLSFDTYKKNLMLGCSERYKTFHQWLLADLRKIHGSTRHITAKTPAHATKVAPMETATEAASVAEPEPTPPPKPKTAPTPEELIQHLTRAMKAAIAKEDFIRAAHLRDQIREIRQNGTPPPQVQAS